MTDTEDTERGRATPDAAAMQNFGEVGAEVLSASLESVQIVKGGDVDDDELAALVAGIAAASAGIAADDFDSEPIRSRWARPARNKTGFPKHGGDAWRWSLR